MVANHFTDVGFNVNTKDDAKLLVQKAMKRGEGLSSPNGKYVRWPVANGIEIWVQLDPAGRTVMGLTPHFSGSTRALLGLEKLRSEPPVHSPVEGSMDAWVLSQSDDPTTGLYPLTLDIPDFDLVRDQLKASSKYEFQIAAFAHQPISCFVDDEAFRQSQLKSPVGVREGKPATFGPESFIPVGQFSPLTSNKPVKAESMISGHITKVDEVTNPEDGGRFFHMVIRSYGIEVDVVADPSIVTGEPQVGGVVSGIFWLSGRPTSTYLGSIRVTKARMLSSNIQYALLVHEEGLVFARLGGQFIDLVGAKKLDAGAERLSHYGVPELLGFDKDNFQIEAKGLSVIEIRKARYSWRTTYANTATLKVHGLVEESVDIVPGQDRARFEDLLVRTFPGKVKPSEAN